MSKITLAHRWNGHQPDETIDVDPQTAKRLVREGRARRVYRSVVELRASAVALDVDLSGLTRLDDIEAAVEAVERSRAPISVLPGDGTTNKEG